MYVCNGNEHSGKVWLRWIDPESEIYPVHSCGCSKPDPGVVEVEYSVDILHKHITNYPELHVTTDRDNSTNTVFGASRNKAQES